MDAIAIDLGDPYPLAVFVTDDTGAPANATAVVVTVTLPDMTTVTPAVTNSVTGTYTATYPTTQGGRHQVNWVATGTNACAFADQFDVEIPGQMLISLAQARASIGLPAANTIKDEDLRELITDATPIMEDLCGPILHRAWVETQDGGSTQIGLIRSPLISVSSVIESYGSNYQRPLTVQDIFTGSALNAFGYTVELDSGIVTRRSAGAAVPFVAGKRNIQITYIAGRLVIGGNIVRATRRLVRHLWQQENQGFRPAMGTPNVPMSTTPSGFAVPTAVVELCAGDLRGPSVA
jgi:hypothetical protein